MSDQLPVQFPQNINIGDNILITVDNWFHAPDGNQYRAVWGKLKGIMTAEQTLGIRPNGRSTNWYIEIGNMIVAGCQVHYAIKSDECSFEDYEESISHEGKCVRDKYPSRIYNANGGNND